MTVSEHIAKLGLRLAVEKTTVMVFSNRVWSVVLSIRLDGHTGNRRDPQVLGHRIQYEGSLFEAYLRDAAVKTQRVMTSLGRLMLNVAKFSWSQGTEKTLADKHRVVCVAVRRSDMEAHTTLGQTSA